MTIEELATDNASARYTLKAQRTYSNIRNMRNAVLRRGFMCKNDENAERKVATIGGVEYIDATNIKNVNSAWLLLERQSKNIILIAASAENNSQAIQKILQNVTKNIKKIIFTSNNKEEITENMIMARDIATNDDVIIFMSFDANETINHNNKQIFEQTIFSL